MRRQMKNKERKKDRIDNLELFFCRGGGRKRVRKAVIGRLAEMRELP